MQLNLCEKLTAMNPVAAFHLFTGNVGCATTQGLSVGGALPPPESVAGRDVCATIARVPVKRRVAALP